MSQYKYEMVNRYNVYMQYKIKENIYCQEHIFSILFYYNVLEKFIQIVISLLIWLIYNSSFRSLFINKELLK